jgi:Spherulation-specific family 4
MSRLGLIWMIALGLAFVGARPVEKTTVRLLVPAYFYPAGEGLKDWDRLIASADRTPIVAIVNPASGPGKRVDENYTKVFSKAQRTKAVLIGYVTLGYAKRPASAVKAEVDRWLELYPGTQGIFFDEQPSQAIDAATVGECIAYARGKLGRSALLVTNPGVVCAREYLGGDDGSVACLFEHEKGFAAYRPPAWAKSVGAGRLAVLGYHVATKDQMRMFLRDSVEKLAANVYVTDATIANGNPWDRLPTYWDDEVNEAMALNRR